MSISVYLDWSKMHAKMIRFMKQVNKERTASTMRSLPRDRWASLKALLQTLAARPEARRFYMRLSDIAFLPEFRTVALVLQPVDDGDTAPLRAHFGNTVEQWERRARGGLCKLILDYPAGRPESGEDPIELATTKFRCRCCRHKNEALFYPAVLTHRCPPGARRLQTPDVYEESVLLQLTASFPRSHKPTCVWTHDDLSVDETSEHSRRLIELSGKDPRQATAREWTRRAFGSSWMTNRS